MKLLMVEDDEMIGSALKDALYKSGYIVDWAKDADEALYGIKSTAYEIVLLDIGLPDKSGFEVLKNIRAEKNPISVLILTAKDSIEDKIYGLDIGADDYMTKPFNLDELLAR
ncbi:MAG: response regulator [Sulfurimonas sp.]|jgi:DNA-binding response OmpR family regulator